MIGLDFIVESFCDGLVIDFDVKVLLELFYFVLDRIHGHGEREEFVRALKVVIS